MSTENTPVVARPSSTVVLLRDEQDSLQVLMVKRRASASFGNSYAFPGGVLEPVDTQLTDRCTGVSTALANSRLNLPENGLAFFVAAIRELFEETGALLAKDSAGGWAFQGDADKGTIAHQAIVNGEKTCDQLLREQDLSLPCDQLHYVSHWETPTDMPKRYSTRFFVALLPPGMRARHDGAELVDSRWASPGELLNEAREQQISLPFPTRSTLKLLAEHDTAASAIAWASAVAERPVQRVRPQAIMVDGKRKVLLPGDPGYVAETS